jgi:hypothetical protein
MVFWIAILVGAVFVWLAVRMGFYQSWCLLFNIVISIYLAIFLAPVVADWAPASGGASAYGVTLSLIALAGGSFAILYGLSYVFLTGQFSIPFPKVLDILVAGMLGFLSGFLVLSFVALVVTVSPLAQHKLFSTLGFNQRAEKANIACIAWCCDLVHSVARFEPTDKATEKAIDRLVEKARSVSESAKSRQDDIPQASVPPTRPQLPLEDP